MSATSGTCPTSGRSGTRRRRCLVRRVVQVGRVGRELPASRLGDVVNVRLARSRGDVDARVALRFADRLLRPRRRCRRSRRRSPARRFSGTARTARRAALQEQHLVVRRDGQQLAQVGLGLRGDRDEVLAAMAHLHHRHAAAVPVEHLLAGLLEHGLGSTAGPALKLKTRMVGSESDSERGACIPSLIAERNDVDEYRTAIAGALPPALRRCLGLGLGTMRSRPTSFSPSSSRISARPAWRGPWSRSRRPACAPACRWW